MNIHNARKYVGDRLIRTAKPHRILDPAQGPLIAVKLNILTRKTLGGFETDLDSRVFGSDGNDHAAASTPPAKPPVSAAAACTAIARWKGRFSAAACFPGEMPDGRRRRRRGRNRRIRNSHAANQLCP